MHDRILDDSAHRPFPLPPGPWIAFQSWRQQLFAHWQASADEVRRLVPQPLEIDTFQGDAWISATPFRVERFHVRGLPPLPPIAEYLELNLRTYVRFGGVPGVWFFSLDASSRLVTAGARALYRLPYFTARMRMGSAGPAFVFESRRSHGEAAFRARYAPSGTGRRAAPGTLEHFLVERYTLFAKLHRGGVLRAHIHHPAWELRPAEADVSAGGLVGAAGFGIELGDALLHYTDRQDTLIWGPERVDRRGPLR